MMVPQTTPPTSSFNPLKLLALFLLLPAIFLCASSRAAPAIYNAYLSTTDYSGFGEKENIGMENYERLQDDRHLTDAITFTGRLTAVKVLILATVPVLAGVLIGLQGRIGRNLNRLLLVLIAVATIPVVLSIIWMGFWGPFWDLRDGVEGIMRDAPDWIIPMSRDGAPNNLTLLHAITFLGVALAAGSVAFIAVMRGRRFGQNTAVKAGVAVWIMIMLWAVLIASDTFMTSFTYRGGPARSTTSVPLLFYMNFAQRFDFGYGAALATPGILAAAIAGIGIWAVMTFFNLRLRFVRSGEQESSNSLWAVLSIPLVLALGLPLIGLVLWGLWYVAANEAFSEIGDIVEWPETIRNSLLVPWLTIWFVQVPFTYLVGLVLGFVRPFGRIVSSLLFLPFLLFAIIPGDLLSVSWFEYVREAELFNTATVRILPWLFGALSLIIFKLYFDGAHDRYQEARQAGKDSTNAFLQDVLLPSLLIVLLVGAVLSFVSAQEFFWPLMGTNRPDQWPASLVMFQIQGQYATQAGMAASVAITYLGILALIFVPAFALLHIFVLDRLALIAGAIQPTTPPQTVVYSAYTPPMPQPPPAAFELPSTPPVTPPGTEAPTLVDQVIPPSEEEEDKPESENNS